MGWTLDWEEINRMRARWCKRKTRRRKWHNRESKKEEREEVEELMQFQWRQKNVEIGVQKEKGDRIRRKKQGGKGGREC